MSIKGIQFIFVFFLVLFAFNFFGANFINGHFIHYSNFIFCLAAIGMALPFAFIKGKVFELPVQLMCLGIVISVLMAYFSWQQPFMYTIQGTVPALLWVFFFWLLRVKFPVKLLETIVIIYAFIYIVLYLFQFSNPNNLLFGILFQDTSAYFGRDIFRIVFPGGGVFFLAVFIALNKLTSQKEGRILWIFFVIAGLVIPVMQVTRTYIVSVLILYLYHFFSGVPYLKNLNARKKVGLIGLICACLFLISQLDIPAFRGLYKAQEETSAQGLENTRIKEAIYFLKDFSPDIFSNLLGNGVPAAPDQSYYGQYIQNLYSKEKFMDDVGIIGMFAMFGILIVIGYVMIWVKSFTLRLPAGYRYAKYYLWFILGTCLTWDTVYSNYYLITTVFALYIFQRAYTDEKTKDKLPSSKYKYNFRYISK